MNYIIFLIDYFNLKFSSKKIHFLRYEILLLKIFADRTNSCSVCSRRDT